MLKENPQQNQQPVSISARPPRDKFRRNTSLGAWFTALLKGNFGGLAYSGTGLQRPDALSWGNKSLPNLPTGKPVHCVELVSGTNLTGSVLIADDELRADIYSFQGFFFLKGEEPIVLQTENNDIVTLHSNVTTAPGSSSRRQPEERQAYHQRIFSNVAVVGHDAWTTNDRVKRVSFAVEHTKQLMHHQAKVDEIGKEKYPAEEHFRIFEVAAAGMTLKGWYSATYGMEFDAPKDFWPTFEIEFEEPRTIGEYVKHVSELVAFLSLCLGARLKPSKIHVDRLSAEEMRAALEGEAYFGDHEVHYIWPDKVSDPDDLWVGGSPVRSWDDHELTAFRDCLAAWMSRAPGWTKSYTLMMMSLSLKNVVSADRLITAFRWLDEIPLAASKNALTGPDIEAIALAATAKAEDLGHHPVIRERIANAIKWVREETSEQRFTRLIALIEAKFGDKILPLNAVAHLKRAIQFRGRTAHGHFNPESEKEFREFSKSIRAMEALCFLLLAVDLPIAPEGCQRLKANPVVRDYYHSYD